MAELFQLQAARRVPGWLPLRYRLIHGGILDSSYRVASDSERAEGFLPGCVSDDDYSTNY